MNGLIDGSLSTLAPIFAVAFATHQPHYAFLAGLATALGAGVSLAFDVLPFDDPDGIQLELTTPVVPSADGN